MDATNTQPTAEPDAPACPQCGYLLIGLNALARCPECGQPLAADLSQYRPSRTATPWSRGHQPLQFFQGLARSMLHPVRTADLCRGPAQVTAGGALIFAMVCTCAIIVLWPLIKEAGIQIAGGIAGDPKMIFADRFGVFQRAAVRWVVWKINCGWEAWSILHLWLLFVVLALVFHRRRSDDHGGLLRRLMLFSPWIAILEVGYLVGVSFAVPNVVPEPSTIFAMWPESLTDVWTDKVWLIRAIIPTFIVSLIFARAVLGWRPWLAVLFAAILAPVAMFLTMLWSLLFMHSGVLDLLYR